MENELLITASKSGEALVYKFDLKDGIDKAKVIKTLTIPSKYYSDQYLYHSLQFNGKLYFFYDKENLAVIDPKSLDDYKIIKIKTKSDEIVDNFGIIPDWSHDQVALFKDNNIVIVN